MIEDMINERITRLYFHFDFVILKETWINVSRNITGTTNNQSEFAKLNDKLLNKYKHAKLPDRRISKCKNIKRVFSNEKKIRRVIIKVIITIISINK